MADKKLDAPAPTAAAAPAASGLKAWLPLIVTLVAMPALAWGTMNFLILPKMKQAGGTPHAAATEPDTENDLGSTDAEPGTANQGAHSAGTTANPSSPGKADQKATFEKVIVNVAGTSGTRYLATRMVLQGKGSKFKSTIEDHKDLLLDLANSTLSSKTIADLERPGARTQIKIELISVFNNALGESLVKEISFPEFVIQ